MVTQQHQQQRQRQSQQSALRMPQTTGTLISIQLKKLPSALNMPQMRISYNDNLRRLATLVLSAPLSSPQSSPTPTATNGQTSPVPHHLTDRRSLILHSCSTTRTSTRIDLVEARSCTTSIMHRCCFGLGSCTVVFVLGAIFILSAWIRHPFMIACGICVLFST